MKNALKSHCYYFLLLLLTVTFQNDPNPNAEVTCDLFGEWQTEDYKPPPAVDVSGQLVDSLF